MYFDYNSDKKLELFIEGESIINNTYQDGFKLSLSDFNEQIFLTEEESKVISCNSSSKPITSIPFTKKISNIYYYLRTTIRYVPYNK